MGKNPYRGKPIPKGRIEWAIKNARSASEASRLLNVSRHTFRKYAEQYELYTDIRNKAGKGISKPKQRSGKYSLDSICNGEHPNYNVWKLGKRLLKAGYFKEECIQCNFDERRITDFRVPLIIDFIDGDKTNHKRENIRFLCYNCYFLMVGNLAGRPVRKMDKELKDLKKYIRLEDVKENINIKGQ